MRIAFREQKKRRQIATASIGSGSYYDNSWSSHNSFVPSQGYAPPPPSPFVSIPPPPPPPVPHHIGQVQMQRGGHGGDTGSVSGYSTGTGSTQSSNPYSYGSIMGGRNEQAQFRGTRNNGRYMGNVISKRRIAQADMLVPEPPVNTVASNEADTNADTCCLGTNFIPLHYTNYPYHGDYKPLKSVPIVTGATAFDHPNGQTYIIIINEGLYFGKEMDHSLLNPNQIRFHGLDFFDNPTRDEKLCMQIDDDLFVPLIFKGTKCSFVSCVPTKSELDNCPHLHVTSSKEWEPTALLRSISMFDPMSDEAILSEISPSLVQLKEMSVSSINVQQHNLEVLPAHRTFISKDRHPALTADSLSERWFIGKQRSTATIRATTQRGIRSAILPISRRYRADRHYNKKRLHAKFATDTLFAPMKSLHKMNCAQIFSNKAGFSVVYPQSNTKGDTVGDSYNSFALHFGVPEHLTFDGFSSQVGKNTKFFQALRRDSVDYHVSAPRRPNENPAEGSIRELKRRFYRVMFAKRVPKRLWDYLMIWISETGNLSVSSSKYANGRTATEIITGETPDISEYADFSFYDWVTFRSNAGLGEPEIGRWCGVSHKIGQLMSYWILPESGIPISCVTVQRMTDAEMATREMQQRMDEFDTRISTRFNVQDQDMKYSFDIPEWNRLSLNEDDPEFAEIFQNVIDDHTVPHADPPPELSTEYNNYVNMEIGMPRGPDGTLMHATVKRRAIDVDGNPMGVPSNNPITDTRLYDVEFIDGTLETISANVIAENLLSQVDQEGHRQMMLKEIIDHRFTNEAIREEDAFYTTHTGVQRRKQTTRGWELCIEWKDGSTQWIAMKDMKNSYPIEVAEYAVNNKIDHLPAFAWWIPYTLKKRQQIISKVKSKYWQRTHKYGIRMPKTVREAYDLDDKNKETYWHDAVADEMSKIINSVQEHTGTVKDLEDVGFKEITGHMIFDIKLGENFRRKARYVADGHKTEAPAAITYSTVVSRDSVRICLTIAALNDLEVLAADIENAY